MCFVHLLGGYSKGEVDLSSPEGQEEITKLLVDMKSAMEAAAGSASETKEMVEKLKPELASKFEKIDNQFTDVNAQLTDISAEAKQTTKNVYDVVLGESAEQIKGMWGYHDQVTKSFYNPLTSYNTRKGGWLHSGKAYDLDDNVYRLNDMCYIMGMMKSIASQKGSHPETYTQSVRKLASFKLLQAEIDMRPELRKALNTQTDGEGQDFVPTGFSAQLIDDIRIELKVAGLFPSITLPGKEGSTEYPLRGARQRAYIIGEPTSDSASKIAAGTVPTDKVSFSPKTHGLRMLFSYIMDEDSAVAVFPLVREELVQAIVDAYEDAIMNGDITATHMDSDVTAANDVRKSFYGLRYHAYDSGSGYGLIDISTLSTAALRNQKKKMGRFGVNPSQGAWITGYSGFIQMLGLTEVITMDKFGSKATVLNGQLASFDGSPVVVSEFMRQNLNASGVYDGTTMTKTGIIYANRKAFYGAEKSGGLMVETDRDIETQQNITVASRRVDFKQVNTPGSTEETVSMGYNLTS